jgi:hypothetical protein
LIALADGNEYKADITLEVKYDKTNSASLNEKLENYVQVLDLIDDEYQWMLVE